MSGQELLETVAHPRPGEGRSHRVTEGRGARPQTAGRAERPQGARPRPRHAPDHRRPLEAEAPGDDARVRREAHRRFHLGPKDARVADLRPLVQVGVEAEHLRREREKLMPSAYGVNTECAYGANMGCIRTSREVHTEPIRGLLYAPPWKAPCRD
jgi:hypothetical protein